MTGVNVPPPDATSFRRTSFARRAAARAALVAAGLLFGLFAAELALWMADLPKVHSPRAANIQVYPHLYGDGRARHVNAHSVRQNLSYDSNPRGYFGPHNEVEHVTNSLGFRGPEFEEAKAPGVLRVAFLGDSFTFGEGVKFPDTFPEVVRARLEQSLPGETRRVECLNFGVAGDNTSDELWCLDKFVWPFQPDLVVLGYVLNDAEPSETWKPPAEAGAPYQVEQVQNNVFQGLRDLLLAQPPDRLIYRLRTARLLWRSWMDRQATREIIARYHALYADDAPGWQENRQALQDIAEQCRQHDVPCVVVLFPVLYRLQDYPFSDIHAKVRDAVGDRAMFIDLHSELMGMKAEESWVHPSDQHPNEIVNAIVAKKIAEEIMRSGRMALQASKASTKNPPDVPQ